MSCYLWFTIYRKVSMYVPIKEDTIKKELSKYQETVYILGYTIGGAGEKKYWNDINKIYINNVNKKKDSGRYGEDIVLNTKKKGYSSDNLFYLKPVTIYIVCVCRSWYIRNLFHWIY